MDENQICDSDLTTFKTQNDLLLLEKKISNNSQNIKQLSLKLSNLYDMKKQYKEKSGIKETYHELKKSLQKQDYFKDNFFKQKELLEEQKKLRVTFKYLREDIHQLNIKIKEIPLLTNELVQLDKQVEVVDLAIEAIKDKKEKLEKKIEKLTQNINKNRETMSDLLAISRKINFNKSTSSLIKSYDRLLNQMNSEVTELYRKETNELSYTLELEENKFKKSNAYKEKILLNKKMLADNIHLLKSDVLLHDEKLKELKGIEKIGQTNNEKLSKIKECNYDEVLYRNLLEQHKTIKNEYDLVLELEKLIENIPDFKRDLLNLQDNDVKYTQEKISIAHLLNDK